MLQVPGSGLNFAAIQSNNSGRPVAAQGTSVTPAVGSKGAWTQVIAALNEDTSGLLICVNNNTASATSRNSVVDVGIGAPGSEVVLIPDLIAGNAAAYNLGVGLWYYFPVAIPAGTRVVVRAQGSVTTAFNVFVQAVQKAADPAAAKLASFVEAIGMTLPQGTAVTAGTTGEGSWTLLGTTAKDCWWWQMGAQISSADTSHANNGYHLDLAVGDGTNFQVLMDSVLFQTSSLEAGWMPLAMVGCERLVPAGSSIYARAQALLNGEAMFISAYGAGG